jgi:hypothetical protein
VLTNNAYDERFSTANKQILHIACDDKMLDLLLSPSWISPSDRKRFLCFAVHVFFRVIDADDGTKDIVERFYVRTLTFSAEEYYFSSPFGYMKD